MKIVSFRDGRRRTILGAAVFALGLGACDAG